MRIILKPYDANNEIMQYLEDKKMISRISCDRINLSPKEGTTETKISYPIKSELGGHKLLEIAVNRNAENLKLGKHEYCEEVLLVNATAEQKPLIWIFSELSYEELQSKIDDNALSGSDFIAVNMAFGNPQLSFFTILPGIIHGECSFLGKEPCPKFYVTEPELMTYKTLELREYFFSIVK